MKTTTLVSRLNAAPVWRFFGCLMLLAGVSSQDPVMESGVWEDNLVSDWSKQKDCSKDTGMCDACGLGVAVVDTNGKEGTVIRRYTQGTDDAEAPFGNDSTVEIASLTKSFTALATLILQEEGTVTLNTPIGDLMNCDWTKAQNKLVKDIQLVDIIKHRSGLPAQPPDRGPSIGGNPFANYTDTRLCASLLKLNGLPTRGRYSYSNYAYGILGYVLTLAVNSTHPPPYEDIIKEKILDPLGMTNTSVTYTEEEWEKNAAKGCGRGTNRKNTTIRTGLYDTLQGNGALRSTINDMAKFLMFSLYVDAGKPTPVDENKYPGFPAKTEAITKIMNAMTIQHSTKDSDLACSCVSDWCEGSICDLPNPNGELITLGGIEGYTSGGVRGWQKSGDTGGYSLRIAWSAEKGRAAFIIDTCGGCGVIGAAGSASQRAALLLADGPPLKLEKQLEIGAKDGMKSVTFIGQALSLSFPSVALVEVTIDFESNKIRIASSDGAGQTVSLTGRVGNVFEFSSAAHYGSGWGAGKDLFFKLHQKRSLTISKDGTSALLQDMGADTLLTVEKKSESTSDATRSAMFRNSCIVYVGMCLCYTLFLEYNSLIQIQ